MALTAVEAGFVPDPAGMERLVFHIAGFDPMPPEQAHRRFVRELQRFKQTWSLASARVSPPVIEPDQATWDVQTTGSNWLVHTRYCFVRWDDVIETASSHPMWRRIPLALMAFVDFIWSGAFWGYCRANWRYAGFFIYPFFVLAVFAAIACVSGAFVDRITGSGLAGLGGGFAAFIALLRWPGRRAHLSLLLDDWIFSRDYIRRGNRVLQERLDRIARTIATEMERGRAEIVVVGHSLGAVLAIDLLDRVLARNPGIGRGASRIALLSVGSSILKIGLHRRALRFRAALERVGLAGGVFWAEYQALTDVMNFYKSDPIATLGLKPCSKPLVRVVRISQMLELDTYRRVRRNFYRVHCQFVSGNDRRAAYDYFMLLCGPLPVERQARSPDGAVSAFSEDGALLPDAPHKPTCEGSQRVCDR